MSKSYYVYITSNSLNTVVYTGFTDNLVKRIYQHKNKLIEGFTSKYNATNLVYYEIHGEPIIAIQREKTIKNMVRRKKNKLISDFNPEWKDLYPEILSVG